jgi:hypothetical protein
VLDSRNLEISHHCSSVFEQDLNNADVLTSMEVRSEYAGAQDLITKFGGVLGLESARE